ncbi:MAG: ABC transporter permease [Deltaproteobacteria bacterium]|nr:ABC transporter permease [Deltaproteobacteria bacterium]
MDFLPILSTLRRHRTAATLVVLEIALTCAIVSNAVFLIRERLARMDTPSGVVEEELVRVRLIGIGQTADAAALTAQDLVALRAIPGVKSVASTNQVPFGNSGWNSSVSSIPDDVSGSTTASLYMGTQDLLETWGVRLIAGRDFTPEEYVDADAKDAKVSSAIVTRALAERLFPGQSPLGRTLYLGSDPETIVGVIDELARPNDRNGPESAAYSMVLPLSISYTTGGTYLIRVEPGRGGEVLAAVDATLTKVAANRIFTHLESLTEVRDSYFRKDRSMAYLLIGVSLALLIITALGIVGLASFWVQQRTRQIGIRRALGASRGDILRYFLLENFILATMGIVVGMGLAYALNHWLMDAYAVPRLPATVLPIGAVALWLLGQLAVLAPALRAARISPAIATRSV